MTSHHMEAPEGAAATEPVPAGTDQAAGSALLRALARAVDSVPGITQREASVGDFLRTLWKRPVPDGGWRPDSNGLHVEREGDEVSLTVALWVSGEHPGTALGIAQTVSSRVNRAIADLGLTAGHHHINVREVE